MTFEHIFIGGNNGLKDLSTTELIHVEKNLSHEGIKLSFTISFHCIVEINANKFIIIGGKQDGVVSGLTWIVDFKHNATIVSGPTLKHERYLMSCGRMVNEQDNIEIIVAGGKDKNGATLDSAEILEWGNDHWRKGDSISLHTIHINY